MKREWKRIVFCFIHVVMILFVFLVLMAAWVLIIPAKSISTVGIIVIGGCGMTIGKRAFNDLFDAIYYMSQTGKRGKSNEKVD